MSLYCCVQASWQPAVPCLQQAGQPAALQHVCMRGDVSLSGTPVQHLASSRKFLTSHLLTAQILWHSSSKAERPQSLQWSHCSILQVLGRKLQLSFTPWGECDADCGAGYNDRSAICADADGISVDVSACSTYSGEQYHPAQGSCMGCRMQGHMQGPHAGGQAAVQAPAAMLNSCL